MNRPDETGERAQMIILEDSRFICTTEVTTLNHNLCVVTFITHICCEGKPVSCRRPGDTLKYGLVFGCQYPVRGLPVRTHHPNLARSNGPTQPLVGNVGTVR